MENQNITEDLVKLVKAGCMIMSHIMKTSTDRKPELTVNEWLRRAEEILSAKEKLDADFLNGIEAMPKKPLQFAPKPPDMSRVSAIDFALKSYEQQVCEFNLPELLDRAEEIYQFLNK